MNFRLDAKNAGSVNYILHREKKLIGHNFDGIGCFNEIEKYVDVAGKSLLVIGAGGSARVAVYEGIKRGANVFVTNRTWEKALALAEKFGAQFLPKVVGPFDIIINATSVGMDQSDKTELIPQCAYKKGVVVLDMASRTGDCLLHKHTVKNQGHYISGKEMFLNLTLHSLLKFFNKYECV